MSMPVIDRTSFMKSHVQLDKKHWENLFRVIQRSQSINKHVEFFVWLQEYVREFLPHDVLVAAWGNFSAGQLHYDVASNISEIRTQHLIDGCDEIDPMMDYLYRRWQDNGCKWYILSDLEEAGINGYAPDSPMYQLLQMKSVLVYGIRDMRGGNDCVYAFFDRGGLSEMQPYLLGILMPHLDSALRRVECLVSEEEREEDEEHNRMLSGMSDREHEIMHWVRFGKTNPEIGVILGISPNTVKNHLKRIFQKMEVSTRAQAVARYAEIKR